jgi:sensor c-di-GMP phosphodiesterase-like protein
LAWAAKYKWAAAVLGVLLTGGPVFWLTSWLQTQGEAEAAIAANSTVAVVDAMIDEAVSRLADLARQGVDGCREPHVEALRRTVFASPVIKEAAVLGPGGQTLCTDSGRSFDNRTIVVSAATSQRDVMLDVVATRDGSERLLRVRRVGPPEKGGLAALLNPNLFLPRVAPDGAPFAGYAHITLADGTLIAASGAEMEDRAEGDARAVGLARSARYGPVVTVAMRRHGVIANYEDLRRIGIVVAGVIALAMLGGVLVITVRQRRSPVSEIERALVAGEFVPYYQPIVDSKTGHVLGAEVLVRWRKPDGRVIGPSAFIALMEKSGLALDLTRSLMRQACAEIGQALARRPHVYVTFNVAPFHFRDALILNDVGSIFDGSPIQLSQVVLELTERQEVENLAATRRVVAALQGLGCRIALDDVGTGHSGLSYILKLGADIIKIDKIFVEAIKTDPQAQAIVATLVDLARNLRMRIVAEGVEKLEQVLYLRDNGITAVQGYVFAPPLPASSFLQLIEASDPVAAEPARVAASGRERAAAA